MKSDELSGYIGEIDDELIINAKKSRPKYKNILLVIGSMAACITIAGAGIFVFTDGKPEIYNGYTEKGTDTSSVITGGAVSVLVLLSCSKRSSNTKTSSTKWSKTRSLTTTKAKNCPTLPKRCSKRSSENACSTSIDKGAFA